MSSDRLPRERIPEIIELLRVAFNGGPSWFAFGVPLEDHFEWKICDPPGGGGVSLTLDANGRLIGVGGSIHRIWVVRGRRALTRDGVDLARHPEWQGRGLTRSTGMARGQDWHPDLEFLFEYDTHPILRRQGEKRGTRGIANETRQLVRVLRPFDAVRAGVMARVKTARSVAAEERVALSHTRSVLLARTARDEGLHRRIGRRVAGFTDAASAFVRSWAQRRPARAAPHLRLRTISRFDKRHESMLRAAAAPFDFIEERSVAFVNWRFCDPRAGRFVVRLAVEGDDALGYAATRLLNGRAYLADLLVVPGRDDVTDALVRDSVGIARRSGAREIEARLPRYHPYRDSLLRAGLVDRGHRAQEVIEPRAIDPRELAFLEDPRSLVHVTFADSDAI